jgi:hypothetical protein
MQQSPRGIGLIFVSREFVPVGGRRRHMGASRRSSARRTPHARARARTHANTHTQTHTRTWIVGALLFCYTATSPCLPFFCFPSPHKPRTPSQTVLPRLLFHFLFSVCYLLPPRLRVSALCRPPPTDKQIRRRGKRWRCLLMAPASLLVRSEGLRVDGLGLRVGSRGSGLKWCKHLRRGAISG